MADQISHELADLLSFVVPQLPLDAEARSLGAGGAGSQPVTLTRRDGDRYLALWCGSAPMPGEHVEVYVARDAAVYSLAACVTGTDRDDSRFLTITGLRRKTQRRRSARAQINDLVLISHNGDVDGTLLDISGQGLSFRLDRPLPVETSIKAVINFHGSVIPTTAQVRNATLTGDGEYRIGCVITHINAQHRALLERYATTDPSDRRATPHRAHRFGMPL
jgi:hypothetical protein